jgi:hypothetical protein
MSYSASTRDRYRLAVAAVSGAITVGALSATGLLAGAASADHQARLAEDAAKQHAEQAAYRKAKREHRALVRASKQYAAQLAHEAEHPQLALRERPQVTRVTTQYLRAGSGSVGSGGTIGSSGGSSGGWSGGSSGGSSGGGSGGGSVPAPPPPPPPPAPSTGS